MVAAGLGIVIFGGSLSNQLTVDRPSNPVGIYTEPYATHGGTTFISIDELWLHRGVWIGAGVLVVVYNLVELRFRKRRPKADTRE